MAFRICHAVNQYGKVHLAWRSAKFILRYNHAMHYNEHIPEFS